MYLTLRFSRLGIVIRALAIDHELARSVGLNVDRAMLVVFLIGSVLAGAAGVLTSLETDLTPQMGFSGLLMAVVATIVGGVGSVGGVVLGALLIAIAQQCGVWFLPSQWQDAIVFLVLIVFLLVRPQGFFGKAVRQVTV
jgi:branched-chain amino acid transport system permease protein